MLLLRRRLEALMKQQADLRNRPCREKGGRRGEQSPATVASREASDVLGHGKSLDWR
jgi:hypothetical protein